MLEQTDVAEATFGFAAPHRTDNSGGTTSHPFRGRLRFETFWADVTARPSPEISLKALLSPTGVKLKAQTVYLPAKAAGDGRAATYDESTRLRGRKFYWHQGSSIEKIDPEHRGDRENEDDPLICPLPAHTRFAGRIHFDNLTKYELGALLVSVCPDLYWNTDGEHGWKIGKGKPRSLGSMHVGRSDLRLELRRVAAATYASLEAQGFEGAAPDEFVGSFRDVVPSGAGRVADLKALLAFPSKRSARNYIGPRPPSPYGWMPDFEDAIGDPKGGRRPAAMKRARDLVGSK
jgi:hypothetical protein